MLACLKATKATVTTYRFFQKGEITQKVETEIEQNQSLFKIPFTRPPRTHFEERPFIQVYPMNPEQQQLHATLQALQQQVAALQQANTVLQHQKELQRNGLALCDEVKELFVAHLQFKQMDAAERKRTLNAYPKSGDLPSALTDSNGLAAKAVGDGQARKLVLTQLPALQRESLDALRVEVVADGRRLVRRERDTSRGEGAHVRVQGARRQPKTQVAVVPRAPAII